ncbi:hypothetical protein [Caldivirga maquilingensis]|uniref:EamA domain-containing protein n=1 Tax=Caldivirga maquilingensis (strain ATCC 700844 / DSM 13496 / JCM 10307 / IC-167) TaxID=397948 RepID=A8M8P5_CALMQ|nr:hypothetical protein [Caldivirga maquilingensis]ABW02114.1 hypothetical protein Cmaq_1287 [Caldivirga maquilingensis IC-167]
MNQRYLALAALASALWGVSYTLTYLALRTMDAASLIVISYVFSILIILLITRLKINAESIIKGVILSPVNFALTYIYVKVSGDWGGFAALISGAYVLPLMLLNYVKNGDLQLRYLISSLLMLTTLYFIGGFSGVTIYAVAVMLLNLAYMLMLSLFHNYEEYSLILGQSIGTLLLSIIMVKGITLTVSSVYYGLTLALVNNTIPYVLYALTVKRIGAVETSLTMGIEVMTAVLSMSPISRVQVNPFPVVLLVLAFMVLFMDLRPVNEDEEVVIYKSIGCIISNEGSETYHGSSIIFKTPKPPQCI